MSFAIITFFTALVVVSVSHLIEYKYRNDPALKRKLAFIGLFAGMIGAAVSLGKEIRDNNIEDKTNRARLKAAYIALEHNGNEYSGGFDNLDSAGHMTKLRQIGKGQLELLRGEYANPYLSDNAIILKYWNRFYDSLSTHAFFLYGGYNVQTIYDKHTSLFRAWKTFCKELPDEEAIAFRDLKNFKTD